jgi:hypothetical protein
MQQWNKHVHITMKQTLQGNNLNRKRDYGNGDVIRESFQVNSFSRVLKRE